MDKFILSEQELAFLRKFLAELAAQYKSAESAECLRQLPVMAHELPLRLRAFLNDFKMLEPPEGYCVISGYEADEAKIGRTPAHWKLRAEVSSALEEELLLLLLGSLLGEPLAWSTQQAGHVVHDVMPIEGHEGEQLGTGSEELLWWHNEDAFHPFRCDYLGMMCLRNPDNVATTVASISRVELDPALVRVLFENRYTIRPDESHLTKNRADAANRNCPPDGRLEEAYQKINRMNAAPEKIAVLYGDPRSPYIRIDPYFMDPLEDDEEGQTALNELIRLIDAHLEDLVLQPGEIVFIDNYRVVHGRKPFKARYDGRDRWLKRINVTRDLRKSRACRPTQTSRVIY